VTSLFIPGHTNLEEISLRVASLPGWAMQRWISFMKLLPTCQPSLATCVEAQTSTESAVQALAGLSQDNTTKISTHGASIKISRL